MSAHAEAVPGAMPGPAAEGRDGLRLDKFLVFARFVRTRGKAQALIEGRRVRINSQVVEKTHALVRPGDVLTFPQGRQIRVVRILQLPLRRGSAPDAALAYEDVPAAGQPVVAGGARLED
ncbi:RNA-binding S4 domain-containing protein [Marinibaculum pumilum]|uniref:RNA-binding S4 domain-containing protein n=1 Tax=Marinibaculum pumilum TaxID=1766165 RepID=A0ABV7KXE9_9PROT